MTQLLCVLAQSGGMALNESSWVTLAAVFTVISVVVGSTVTVATVYLRLFLKAQLLENKDIIVKEFNKIFTTRESLDQLSGRVKALEDLFPRNKPLLQDLRDSEL